MKTDAVILIAEDDAGHFELVKKNLWRSAVQNEILHFNDGKEVGKLAGNEMMTCFDTFTGCRVCGMACAISKGVDECVSSVNKKTSLALVSE